VFFDRTRDMIWERCSAEKESTMNQPDDPYMLAQGAIAQLKSAIHLLLSKPPHELKNVEIGRLLGILMGHVRHEGHIPRALLAIMEAEGVVEQNPSNKTWRLRTLNDLRGRTDPKEE
jgi:hypothetical protein